MGINPFFLWVVGIGVTLIAFNHSLSTEWSHVIFIVGMIIQVGAGLIYKFKHESRAFKK